VNTAITATETETTSVAIFADLFFYQNRKETIIMSLLGMAILCKKFCETREMEWYPFFLAEKISTQKKKKGRQQEAANILFLLNFFVLFWFLFLFLLVLGSYQILQNKTLHESFHKNSHKKQTSEEEEKKKQK
jgi:ABC-type Fe3+ transport system permease subunit